MIVAATSAASAADDISAYVGAFRHSGGDKERLARDKAIDDVVSGMSFVVRGIARGRLTSANPIAVDVTCSTHDKSLTMTMDQRSFTAPIDGSTATVKSVTGDDIDMHYAITKNSLIQVFDRDGRGRVNTFTLDGTKGLAMAVRVYAKQLPKDLNYRLTYERS